MNELIARVDQIVSHLKNDRKILLEYLDKLGASYFLNATGQTAKFLLRKTRQKDLNIAVIMDRFTLECYRPEANLLELTPQNWKEELEYFDADFVFIESAWEGKEKFWYKKIANGSSELTAIGEYCHAKNIPIVFWNKEDPVYTDQFMAAAMVADVVFTTDVDCITKYKAQLGHNRVYLLHFAAQPQLHNPVEKYNRKDKFCFAGAYYHRYIERCKVFDDFSHFFLQGKGMDIYDRNFKNARPEHAFPECYAPYILGKLDTSEIDIAYKAYLYGVNMNSIQQSQTMFARRVFELMASNTVTVGNYSRGIKNLFGNLTICTDDVRTLHSMLDQFCNDIIIRNKYRLLGLRKVLSENLYEDRLNEVIQKVFGKSIKPALPSILVVAYAKSLQECQSVYAAYRRQTYGSKKLLLITDVQYDAVDIIILSEKISAGERISEYSGYDFYAALCPQDYYGTNYLTDLALSTRYCNSDAIGKGMLYEKTEEGIAPPDFSTCYCEVEMLYSTSSIAKASRCSDKLLKTFALGVPVGEGFSIDAFHYCKNGGNACSAVDDLREIDQGVSMVELQRAGQQTGLMIDDDDNRPKKDALFISRSNVLVVTNVYPSQDSLYRNMFVHKRIKAYQEAGLWLDVLTMDSNISSRYREFDGINVVNGDGIALQQILETGKIDTVCIHFLNAPMWESLKPYLDRIRLFIWAHGSEIQPWWRRDFLFHSERELVEGKLQSEQRMALWREVFSFSERHNISFVFISQWFANSIFKDYNFKLPQNKYHIIHNYIDTELFAYSPKPVEQRKKILSIRPYASNVYANDLAVKCILTLAKEKWFKELEFCLIGSGELFEKTVKPLRKFKNITLQKRFLRQEEIAALHKAYGVFLVPTRMDTQGVSRDEAMSSGLVPVTNEVAAISEFVDESCGILAPEDDYLKMVEGIKQLYYDPARFAMLSQNAAIRVRAQTAKAYTIQKELELLCPVR